MRGSAALQYDPSAGMRGTDDPIVESAPRALRHLLPEIALDIARARYPDVDTDEEPMAFAFGMMGMFLAEALALISADKLEQFRANLPLQVIHALQVREEAA